MRSDMRNLYYDVAIAGCGVAGLYAALNLPEEMSVLMLSKEDLESCDSMLAQGGICVLRDEEDYDSYFEDTMRAGHYENRKESVDIMIRSSRDVMPAQKWQFIPWMRSVIKSQTQISKMLSQHPGRNMNVLVMKSIHN
jgi:aspartate oxidase